MMQAGTRQDRRAAAAIEVRARRTGQWGSWRLTPLPNGIPGSSGWCREIREAAANDLYAVLMRPCFTAQGVVTHCAISTASGAEPPWRDKQRIKNELFGADRMAVEVMPTEANLIDDADMYHMWVLPVGMRFDFGLNSEGDRNCHPQDGALCRERYQACGPQGECLACDADQGVKCRAP